MSERNPYFTQCLLAAERAARMGMPITPEVILSEDSDLEVRDVVETLESPRFALALEERGINFTPMQRLDDDQVAAVHLYLADSSRSHAQKLRAAGVSQVKWSGWMRQPRFKQYIAEHATDRLYDALPGTHLALADKAEKGESWAVGLLYQVTGFHDPNKVDDPRRYFEAIFEILSDEGVDVAILRKVAGRIRELEGADTSANPRQAMIVSSPQREAG